MYFTSLLSIIALALASGALGDPKDHLKYIHSLESGNVCRTTTWKFDYSDATAKALGSDCKNLEKRLRKAKKTGYELVGWATDDNADDYYPIEFEGTCNFSANVIKANDARAVIAGGDIADLLRDAVKFYSDGDHVSEVTGTVPCKSVGDHIGQTIGWKISAA
ncbi:hypothetical protein F4859DRAFT_518827 [Xylaria cf. heliscus]|nr:hypothetical protein F4859DRAFT_518827 [Xylaria cf. heliscus]